MAKIKIGEMVNRLIAEVDEIDASDIPQGIKTKKHKAAASRFKNALFADKRKYRGKGLAKRVTANTYNTYMSRARSKFDDRLHHAFEKNVTDMAAKYPLYADELNSWLNLPVKEIRVRAAALKERLKEIMPLSEALGDVRLGTKAAEKKVITLGSKYPGWKLALFDLNAPDWREARERLYKYFQEGERLLDDLMGLRINHEVMYALTLSQAERVSIQKRWGDVLDEKKRSTVLIDYPAYMQAVLDILHTPTSQYSFNTRTSMAPLAFALAAVSGRRMIEIMRLGEFTPTGRYTVDFVGQAKKRSEEDGTPRTIYTLCDSALFVDRLNILRGSAAAADFDEVVKGYGEDDTRSENGRISTLLGNAFNAWVKTFFRDDRRVFKDSRAIYARIAYESWFRVDPRWAKVDEDVFFSEILGHDDEGTQLHYKQFKLHNFSRSWKYETGEQNSRLAGLHELDDMMPGFARGDAAIKLHDEVKRIIEAEPGAIINSTRLRALGFNTRLIQRYLDVAADALGQTIGENGRLQLAENVKAIVLDNDEYTEELADDEAEEEEADDAHEDDEIELVEESTTEPAAAELPTEERPRFDAPKRNDRGEWVIRYEFGGERYAWAGTADNIRDAMEKAWRAYHD
ncbi:protelomerase family protein [Pantoea vagans]|uniref:protelomerase family protein n=1 Tax=Pantoea vagans TaxID=470934 RepID=UPI0023B1E6C7|nr:protelomerase family protein [Pantoea vagans]MDE8559063.1 protelomerase family protein [Pantoea vagans]